MAELNGLSSTAGDSPTAPESQTSTFQMPDEFVGKSTEEIAQAYLRDRESWDSQRQELEPLRQVQQQLQAYGGFDAFAQSYGQIWDAYQTLQQQVMAQQQSQNQPPQEPQHMSTNSQNPGLFDDNWDYLTPRQQQERMYQAILQQVSSGVDQRGQALYQQALQLLQQENAALRREFDVYRNVNGYQQRNPDADMQSILQDAVKLREATPEEWLEIAAMRRDYQSGKGIEEKAKELFEKRWAEEELKRQNEAIGASITGPGGQSFANYFPDSSNNSMEPAQVHQRVLERVLNDPGSGITPAHIG